MGGGGGGCSQRLLYSAIYYFTKLSSGVPIVKFEQCTSLVPPKKMGGSNAYDLNREVVSVNC